jgi:hypothetical protein
MTHFTTNHPEILRCKHDPRNLAKCIEKNKISWDKNGYDFIHFRFDGCICSDNRINKCDCAIFRIATNGERPVLFLLETKKKRPVFTLVHKQLQTGITIMLDKLPNPKTEFIIVPVLLAAKINSHVKEASLSNHVKIFGKKERIKIATYQKNINDLV